MIPLVPFRALRPTAARAREFSVPRVEHLQAADLAEAASGSPYSLAAVLQRGNAELLDELQAAKALIHQTEQTFYMHRNVKGGHRCFGLVACIQSEAFHNGSIRHHRQACSQRTEQWKGTVAATGVQMDSVIVGFHLNDEILDLLEREMNERPLFHVVADDSATHTMWLGTRSAQLMQAFAEVSKAYVLEGHHRTQALHTREPVLALLVPLAHMIPQWSARVLGPDSIPAWRRWLAMHGTAESDPGIPPDGFADIGLPADHGKVNWFRFPLPTTPKEADAFGRTSDGRLNACIHHITGVDAERCSVRRPGQRSVQVVSRWMTEKEVGGVVLLPQPDMAELLQIADQGVLLPIGSTWFEPSLRSGLWMHRSK